MNKVINSKTVFCNYHEISLSDGILHDGLELSIRNMENPKEYVSVPLDKETIKSLAKVFNEAEMHIRYVIEQGLQFGENPTEDVGYKGIGWRDLVKEEFLNLPYDFK